MPGRAEAEVVGRAGAAEGRPASSAAARETRTEKSRSRPCGFSERRGTKQQVKDTRIKKPREEPLQTAASPGSRGVREGQRSGARALQNAKALQKQVSVFHDRQRARYLLCHHLHTVAHGPQCIFSRFL